MERYTETERERADSGLLRLPEFASSQNLKLTMNYVIKQNAGNKSTRAYMKGQVLLSKPSPKI